MEKEVMDLSNRQVGTSSGSCSKSASRRDAGGEIVVGFDDDARKLVEQLMGDKKKLQIISIVGMPGLGKTTLARKVYNDPMIVYRFYIRGWTYVTQVPRKRDLLIGILRSGFDYKDEDNEISDEKLSEMLKRRLSGQRYLIVMDDIWDIGAWNVLKWSFSDNENGSRIIFTSRLAELPLRAQPEGYRHHLRFLSDEESWDLLQHKVFQGENHLKMSSVDDFLKIYTGKEISRKCHGLPLTIVLVAGILANDLTLNWWRQVAKDMSNSYVPRQYMDTLALSYNHLPPHLKPCFMYFGAFPEDYEIPVWKLILLWVAEGFIHKTGENNNLEDIAAGFLKDLIHRSLVIVAKRGSDGGIKACIVHDLLRDLCLTKAHEEKFLQQFERQRPKEVKTFRKKEIMGSRVGASVLVSRANRIKTKLQSALDATVLEVEDVSYQHAGHVAVKDNPNNETHFNLKIISPKFDGQTLVKRHRMVYDLLADELESGLHALSIQAKTPKEAGSAGHS